MPKADNALEGVRVLVTRPEARAGHLVDLIRRAGGEPLVYPTLEISPIDPDREAVRELAECDTVIFVSATAVQHGFRWLPGGQACDKRIAAIGPATRRALTEKGCDNVEYPGESSSTEALLRLETFRDVGGRRIVIVRGRGGREALRESLAALGARVTYLECYERRMPRDHDPRIVTRALESGDLVLAITATSVEGLSNLIGMIPAGHHAKLFACPLVVIGDRQKDNAVGLGWQGPLLVSAAGDERIIETLVDWRHQH